MGDEVVFCVESKSRLGLLLVDSRSLIGAPMLSNISPKLPVSFDISRDVSNRGGVAVLA
jgi:hypothetical protein